MSNKIIIVLIIWVFLDVFSFTVYADDSTHGGGDLVPEYIKPEKEGYVCDTLELDGCISKLDGENITESIKGYGKVYINTCPDNRGYIWVSVIKQLGGIRIMYATDDSIELLDNGMYYSYVQAFGNPPSITKPEFTLEYENWTAAPLFSPSDIPIGIWWGNDEVKYDYDIHVDSTLPVYYNSFDTMDDYNAWYSSGSYNLNEHPDQDYSQFGFTPEGDLSDGNIYDLEVPLNLKVKNADQVLKDNFIFKDIQLRWEQSDDVNVEDWYTQIYMRVCGKWRKYPWSEYVKYDSDYTKEYGFYKEEVNVRRLCVFDKDDMDKYHYRPNKDDIKGTSVVEEYYFKMRNMKYDNQTKITHYSNWITWKVDAKTGDITCVENKDPDVTNKDDDNINYESEHYKPDEKYNDKNKDSTSSNISLDSFLDYLKQAVNTIGNIPSMIGTVFSWLPPIYTTIIVAGIGLLILLRVLGR